ncbi:MAG: hypothetical protein ACRD5J_03225 [Nitrososphaeraceae archaeon]
MMLYSLIDVMRYDISRTLSVYANQTAQLPDVKITSHVQGQLVPTGMLSIMGVSADNSSSVCDVYIILNEIRPYQRVYPTGSSVTGNNDYSTWNYTFTPEYATTQEGNNRMVSKITCLDDSSTNNENLTKFNSLNLTGITIEVKDTNNSELSTSGEPSLELSENITYLDTFQLQNSGSTIPIPNNTASNSFQHMDIQDNVPGDVGSSDIQNEDDIDEVEYSNYKSSSSKNEDDEKESDFLQELHDRVLDQVTERLRESGIDFPP